MKIYPTCPYYKVSQLSIIALFFFFLNPSQFSFSLCQNVSLRTPEHNTPVFHFKNTISLQEDRKNLQIATDLPVNLASFSTWPILGDTLTHIQSDASEWKPRCLMVDFAAPDSLIILIWVTSWSDAFHICYLCFQLHQCKCSCIVECAQFILNTVSWRTIDVQSTYQFSRMWLVFW